MTNKNNKISGNKYNVIQTEKEDIKNVFIFCIFKRVKSSSPRVGFNVITFLSNRFPVVTSITDPVHNIVVVSLFPQYFSHTYGVNENTKINIIVKNIADFMSYTYNAFASGNYIHDDTLYIFHGFRWSQIIHMFALYNIDVYGVKTPVRHTVNSLQIKLFSYLITVFGSLDEVGKHLIEGTHFATFWGSAKLERPVYKAKSSNWEQFLAISIQSSSLISNYLLLKEVYFKALYSFHKEEGIDSEIEMLIKKKESLLSDKYSYINSKEAQVIKQQYAIDELERKASKANKISEKSIKQIEKKKKKQIRYQESKKRDILEKSKEFDVNIQETETDIKRLNSEKENIYPAVSDLKKEFELKKTEFLLWISREYSSDSVLSELRSDISITSSSIEEDLNNDMNKISVNEEKRNAKDLAPKIMSDLERSDVP
jgi:hypothetical protein